MNSVQIAMNKPLSRISANQLLIGAEITYLRRHLHRLTAAALFAVECQQAAHHAQWGAHIRHSHWHQFRCIDANLPGDMRWLTVLHNEVNNVAGLWELRVYLERRGRAEGEPDAGWGEEDEQEGVDGLGERVIGPETDEGQSEETYEGQSEETYEGQSEDESGDSSEEGACGCGGC
ncbi:hypothetical protein EDC01DRAFT_751346 [Geopyxis carbonaria]|nr:hypothetical protein EDC01DRAFT_751346 [Geopyxis carbonaria]